MRKRLPRFQFALRTLLIAGPIIAGGIGLLVHRHVAERAAEAELVANGLSISFEPWGSNGQYWAYDQDYECQRAVKTFTGRLKWEFLRHARLVNGQRSAQLMDEPSNINDESLAPLQDLRHVELLYLGFQPITNDGLTHLRKLRSLKYLNLCGTDVTDDGLARLSDLSDLEDIALEFTAVSDAGLKHLRPLRKLRDLSFMDSKITGPGLEYIGTLPQLNSLGISDMPIRSDSLRHLSGLKNLETLFLSNTEIDDSASKHIAKLTSLKTLWVDHTSIGDEFITGIVPLKNLTDLNVDGTRITNASESAIRSFPMLEQFYASETGMDDDTLVRVERFTVANAAAALDRLITP